MTATEPRSPKRSPRYLASDDTVNPAIKVATFCDWTDCVPDSSNSSFGDRPAFPQRHPNAARVAKMKQYYSTGIRMLSGRFFVKEKTTLTKGEREIISGIVQNRGDIQAEEAFEDFSNPIGLQSHRDAWLLGKNSSRLPHPVIRADDPYTCCCHFNGKGNSFGCMECNPASRYCRECAVKSLNVHVQQPASQGHTQMKDFDVTVLPVSSTTQAGEWPKKRKVPPINSSKGAVYVKNVMYKNKLEPSCLQKRTLVDVYLPRLDDASEHPEPPAPPSSPVYPQDEFVKSQGVEEDNTKLRLRSLDLGCLRKEIGRIEEDVLRHNMRVGAVQNCGLKD